MEINSHTVSVVIPLYNQAKFVGEAIQSVLNQTYRDYEVIVVNDGSSDDGREVVSRFGDQIFYAYQENQGLASARNTGIRAAKGELIGLLDADDQWLPFFLETMVTLANRYPQAAVFFCAAQSMDADGYDLLQRFGDSAVSPETIYRHMLRANFIIPSTVVFRRSIVLEAGLFDHTLKSCEDWDLWLRLLPNHTFIGTSECLVRYRLHKSSLSTNLTNMHQAAQATIEKNLGLNDGRESSWTPEKRRGYGGLYRYFTLTSVQRQNSWQTAGQYLRQALQADPTLATDVELFYELALGTQPPGYRGTLHQLSLEENAEQIVHLLTNVFRDEIAYDPASTRRLTYGTAYFALGLVAYNSGKFNLSRQFLLKALHFRHDLWRDKRLMGNVLKSFAGHFGQQLLRGIRDNLTEILKG